MGFASSAADRPSACTRRGAPAVSDSNARQLKPLRPPLRGRAAKAPPPWPAVPPAGCHERSPQPGQARSPYGGGAPFPWSAPVDQRQKRARLQKSARRRRPPPRVRNSRRPQSAQPQRLTERRVGEFQGVLRLPPDTTVGRQGKLSARRRGFSVPTPEEVERGGG